MNFQGQPIIHVHRVAHMAWRGQCRGFLFLTVLESCAFYHRACSPKAAARLRAAMPLGASSLLENRRLRLLNTHY